VIRRSKTAKPTVELRPSRIRRQPVREEEKKKLVISEEREIWGGVAGILLFAVALAIATLGVSAATLFHENPAAAAKAAEFQQCYSSDGANCVIDGDTIYVAGEKLAIAGIVAPRIQGARCEDERNQGITAAVQLADLLNSGKVAVGAAVRGPDGQVRRAVAVNGRDVGAAMVDLGAAREADGGAAPNWCS